MPEPDRAETLPDSLRALRRLSGRVRQIAFISGRATADLERLVPVPGAVFLGDYGLGRALPAEADELRRLAVELEPLTRGSPPVRVEPKPGSLSVHFREHPGAGREVFARVEELARARGLEASSGRLVVEVRPPRAGKGKALARLIAELEPEGVLFGGDDEGDRAAFQVLASSQLPHLAVGVASGEAPQDLFAACDLVLQGPREFSRLLDELAAWANRPGP